MLLLMILAKKKKNKHPTITTANDTSRYLKWLLLKRNQMSTSKEQLLLERKLLNDRCNEYFGVLFQNIFKQRSSASLQSSSAMHYSPLHRQCPSPELVRKSSAPIQSNIFTQTAQRTSSDKYTVRRRIALPLSIIRVLDSGLFTVFTSSIITMLLYLLF